MERRHRSSAVRRKPAPSSESAPEDAISALRGYGDDLGLAFQIMDDVLDLTGGRRNPRQTGRARSVAIDHHPPGHLLPGHGGDPATQIGARCRRSSTDRGRTMSLLQGCWTRSETRVRSNRRSSERTAISSRQRAAWTWCPIPKLASCWSNWRRRRSGGFPDLDRRSVTKARLESTIADTGRGEPQSCMESDWTRAVG